jgi:hypothetical protein
LIRTKPFRPALQTPYRPPYHPDGMDMDKMNRQEIEALLKLLAEWEREDL